MAKVRESMALSKEQAKLLAREELVRRGDLSWLLHPGQQALAKRFYATDGKVTVWNCSRRFGKSYMLVVLALEQCLRKKGMQVRFATSTQKQIASIFEPLMDQILLHFPKDCLPSKNQNVWKFPNKSTLTLAGADYKDGDALRGVGSDLIIVDEAGFVGNLKYLVQDILLPQLLTTNGRLIMASTPPKSMGHDFVTFAQQALEQKTYERRTIYDNAMLSKPIIDAVKIQCGGEDTDTFKREYLCEFISDSQSRIIPEFNELIHVKKEPMPTHYQPYTCFDFGLKDHTAVLFGYLDFLRQKLVVQDEIIVNYKTTKEIAEMVKKKEAALWGNRKVERFGDNDLQILWDMGREYGLNIKPAIKFDKDAGIANCRDKFMFERIEVWPNCHSIIFQLKNGVWNDKRTSFQRDEVMGHCDALDALIYMVRHIKWKANPVPARIPNPYTEWVPEQPKYKEQRDFSRLFNIRKKGY